MMRGNRRMNTRKGGSEREVSAVMSNLKEQRALEKRVHMLNLEQTFSSKLRDLDHKLLMVGYRRLQERVSRIKSHLSTEQILEMKVLEDEGRLKTSYSSVNISGAMKIAAAAKRLGMGQPPGSARRAKSAQPSTTRSTATTISIDSQPTSARQYAPKQRPSSAMSKLNVNDNKRETAASKVDSKVKNSSAQNVATSVTGATNGLPRSGNAEQKQTSLARPQSTRMVLNRPASGKASARKSKASDCRTVMIIKNKQKQNIDEEPILPLDHSEECTALAGDDVSANNGSDVIESQQSDEVVKINDNETSDTMSAIASVRFANKPKSVHATSSSSVHPIDTESIYPLDKNETRREESYRHSTPQNGTGEPTSPTILTQSIPRSDSFSGDESNLNLGNNCKFEERRRGLIEMENVRVMALQERKSELLEKIDKCVEENPVHIAEASDFDPQKIIHMVPVLIRPGSSSEPGSRVNSASSTTRGSTRRGSHRGRYDQIDLRNFANGEAWKDINKCRYLRIHSEKIDLSGVNTLVKDQMQMFNFLKSPESSSNMTERFNPIDI